MTVAPSATDLASQSRTIFVCVADLLSLLSGFGSFQAQTVSSNRVSRPITSSRASGNAMTAANERKGANRMRQNPARSSSLEIPDAPPPRFSAQQKRRSCPPSLAGDTCERTQRLDREIQCDTPAAFSSWISYQCQS